MFPHHLIQIYIFARKVQKRAVLFSVHFNKRLMMCDITGKVNFDFSVRVASALLTCAHHLIPGLGRSPGGGHSNPFQYSCLENPHGQRSLTGYSSWGHKESDVTEAT